MHNKSKLLIVVGHYGSGKTEFAVNYALYLKKQGISPVIADVDIVNPYFRARELKEQLLKQDIKIISNNYEDEHCIDMPALAAALQTCFESELQTCIADVGGDSAGARVLSRYSKAISNREYDMWIAVNANRPKTACAQDTIEYMEDIERVSGLKINGIINTTHMLRETTPEDILKGEMMIEDITQKTGIDLLFNVVDEKLTSSLKNIKLSKGVFTIKPLLLLDWL